MSNGRERKQWNTWAEYMAFITNSFSTKRTKPKTAKDFHPFSQKKEVVNAYEFRKTIRTQEDWRQAMKFIPDKKK